MKAVSYTHLVKIVRQSKQCEGGYVYIAILHSLIVTVCTLQQFCHFHLGLVLLGSQFLQTFAKRLHNLLHMCKSSLTQLLKWCIINTTLEVVK